jgi:hypothetical protein
MKRFIRLALFFALLMPIVLKAQQEIGPAVNLRNNDILFKQNTTKIALNNVVQIQQIGDYNAVLLQLSAVQSHIDLNQIGNHNEIYYYNASPYLTQTIQQRGNSNVINHFSSTSHFEEHKSFTQQGNNLTLFSNGTNSISKEMTVNQYGNSGTVYIFNR